MKKENPTGAGRGCGFGCGSLSIIAVLFLVGSYFFIDSKINALDEIEDGFDQLKEKYGEIESFVPYTDGVIPANRIEKFLQIRESISGERMELEQSLLKLSEELKTLEDGESLFEMAFVIKELISAIPDIVDYVAVRNEKLLEMDLGLGEYYYIYVSGFYAMLQKSPGSGTDAIIIHRNENSISIGLTDEDKVPKYSGDEATALRNERITNESNKFLQRIFANLAKVNDSDENIVERGELIDSENILIDKKYFVNLEPFKDRLERSFSSIVNPIEVIFIAQ